ncbi:hypothetical protein MUCCIDRAFT_109772 [Mucor lusitanicus CBS 277.49]|uniref:Retrotransposon gag domain-containing protein n=1 Tax=Mucor lusitanicus CBS 277.49 TaxID=747725 RepID=A0A168KYJ3_MUCCL|nr:hypothetical protein MUCCIDRAFT_109772 [Mucor lusitanicus CBS 277.49]
MPPKKSVNKNAAVDTTSPGVTQATTDGPSVVTDAPTVTPPVTQVQDATAAAPMEIDDAAVSDDAHDVNGPSGNQFSNVSNNNPVVVSAVPVNHDVINGNASVASPPNDVGTIHGDVPRTSVQPSAINGDASGAYSNDAAIHGNAATFVGDAPTTNASTTTFYHVPVPQGFATPISSDERLTLINEIERLKLMVFKATINSIGCPEGSIVPYNFGVLRNQLETAERTYELVFGKTESTLVPNETPFFQWRGHFFNKRRAVFATPNDCLDHFELVLQAHRLSIHDNWERIVPAKLSTGMARWYAGLVSKQGRLTWSEFCAAVTEKYGKSMVDMRDEAREELEHLEYQQGQSLTQFMDRFQQLRSRAEIQDENCIVRYLIKSLPEELASYTKFSLNISDDKEAITVDTAVNKITGIYNALFKDKWKRERATSTTTSSAPAPSIQARSHGSTSSHQAKKCIYHPNATNHRTKYCRASDSMKRRIDAAQKRFGDTNTRTCHDCKEPGWTPAHKAVCKKKHNQPRFRKASPKKSIVPVPHQADDSSDDNMDTDTESDEQNMTFAAMNIKDCEYQYMNEPPRNLLNKNSIILPITLEHNGIKVRTYFLMDTGSSFSCISPKLAHILEIKINKNIKGTIKTCKKDTVIDRIGSTEEDIKITYCAQTNPTDDE